MQDYLIAIGALRALSRHGIEARLWADDMGLACSFTVDPSWYCPPAVVTPWNGRWNGGSGPKLRSQVAESTDPRLARLRDTLALIPIATPSDKAQYVAELRNILPDEAVEWIDATWVIDSVGELSPVRIAGTGGNWGSQDLGVTALRAAIDIASSDRGEYHVQSRIRNSVTRSAITQDGILMLTRRSGAPQDKPIVVSENMPDGQLSKMVKACADARRKGVTFECLTRFRFL